MQRRNSRAIAKAATLDNRAVTVLAQGFVFAIAASAAMLLLGSLFSHACLS